MSNLDRAKFILAGHAVFTITSTATGQSFTYKVSAPKDTDASPGRPYFASVLTGPNNQADYTYLGMLRNGRVVPTRASTISPDAPSFVALNWFLGHVNSPKVEFRHEGKCCRCGRALTRPESIDSGMGPECAGRV
jgi:hypothetical protein